MWQNTMTYDVGTVQCEDGTTRCETKNKGITECDKNTITCDVNIAQYEDNTIKCGKKKAKNKGTTECNKSTIICDVLHNIRMVLSNVRKKLRNHRM